MPDRHPNRWKLLDCDISNGEFIVHDALFNKERSFFVPLLLSAIVVGHQAYVATSTRKIMRVDLNTTKRQFVSASHLNPDQLQHLLPSHQRSGSAFG